MPEPKAGGIATKRGILRLGFDQASIQSSRLGQRSQGKDRRGDSDRPKPSPAHGPMVFVHSVERKFLATSSRVMPAS